MATSTKTTLTSQQQSQLSAWRSIALERMPYMASILFKLRPVNAVGLKTFAVDAGGRLYIDFDHFAVQETVGAWNPSMGAQALLHECMHIIANHNQQAELLGITTPVARQKWNVAADASINDDLRDAGCEMFSNDGQFILPCKLGARDYLTPEHYLNAIAKNEQANTDGTEGTDGDSAPDGGEGDQEAPSLSGRPVFGECGTGAGGLETGYELDDKDRDAPAISESEMERARIEVAVAVQEYVKNGRGKVPGNLIERAEELTSPADGKIPWQRVLGRIVRQSVQAQAGQNVTTYSRRNPRRHNEQVGGSRVVIPGTVDYKPRIAVVRDTSGSMSAADLKQVSHEIESISRRLRVKNQDLVVLDVDTTVHRITRYAGSKSVSEVHGRGGTDMMAGIQGALDLKPKPDVVIVITDGGTDWEETPTSRTPVVACIVGEVGAINQRYYPVPAWIKTVVVEEV